MPRTYELDLAQPPHIIWAGIGKHGSNPVEQYLLPDLWCVHLFRDEMQLRVGDDLMAVKPGCATIIPPGLPIEFRFQAPTVHWHACSHFKVDGGGNIATIPAIQDLGNRFETLFVAMETVIDSFGRSATRSQAGLWNLLWDLTRANDEEAAGSLLRRARELIERRLGEPFRISQLADELGVSHNHLTRQFREHTGQSVVEYIRERRVARARHLLRHSTLPIKAIANQVGVSDLHSFNKIIKRVSGQSPRYWQREKS